MPEAYEGSSGHESLHFTLSSFENSSLNTRTDFKAALKVQGQSAIPSGVHAAFKAAKH